MPRKGAARQNLAVDRPGPAHRSTGAFAGHDTVRMGDTSRPVGRVLAYGLGAVVGAVAWAALVRMAIDLGRSARVSGAVLDWTWTVLATLAATACLLVVLVLFARGWAARPHAAEDRDSRRRPGAHRRD
jgi:hypothetical protein